MDVFNYSTEKTESAKTWGCVSSDESEVTLDPQAILLDNMEVNNHEDATFLNEMNLLNVVNDYNSFDEQFLLDSNSSSTTMEEESNTWPGLDDPSNSISIPSEDHKDEISKTSENDVEYGLDCSSIGNEYTNLNSRLQNLQQQHGAYMTPFPISATSTLPYDQNYADALVNHVTCPEMGSLTPISIQQPTNIMENVSSCIHPNPQLENYNKKSDIKPFTSSYLNITPKMLRTSPNFFKKMRVNFPIRRSPLIDLQENNLERSKLFQGQQLIPQTEMNIVQPMNTDQVVRVKDNETNLCDVSKPNDLSKYFDTSSMVTPMIRERSLSVKRTEDRRKQKLCNIPGSENLIFEVYNEQIDFGESSTPSKHVNSYSENKLPKSEDIYKRKKKTQSLSGSKRACLPQSTVSVQSPKKHIQFSTVSIDEKAAMVKAITKSNRSNNCERSDTEDKGDYEDLDALSKNILKCYKCKAVLKAKRSVLIHEKRCEVGERVFRGKVSSYDNNPDQTKKLATKKDMHETLSSSKDEWNIKSFNNAARNAGPLTRSQTRSRS